MKLLILLSSLLISSTVHANLLRSVLDWNPNIPTSQKNVLELIQAEADYFSFETDTGVCGGEVSDSQLVEYSSFTTDDGNEVHQMTLRFYLSKSENYCESESLTLCYAPIQVLSENGIVMGDWACKR